MIQVHTSHAELLMVYVEPPGPRTDRILALYDTNRDGQIDGIEQRLARRLFIERAFFGLDIGFDTQSAPKTAEIRYKRDKNGGISVAILQRIDLVIDSNDLSVNLALAPGETIIPVDAVVEPADAWHLKGDEAPEKRIALRPGARVQVALSRTPTKPDGKPGDWKPNLPE